MRKENSSTMSWEEAPAFISPKELSKITGLGIVKARKIFDKPDFPKIPKSEIGNIGRADKEAAEMYMKGIKFTNNSKDTLLSMIYYELKKINSKIKIEEIGDDKNE